MPAPRPVRQHPWAALLLAACAGCAAPGATTAGEAPSGSIAGKGSPPSPSVLAVRAFVQICGALQAETVAQRAQAYAFIPLETAPKAERLAAELRAKGLRGWIRPVSGTPALLSWSEQAQRCELALGGIEPGEVEREFAAMGNSLEKNGLAVTRIPPRADQSGPMRLRQVMVVTPRGLVPGQPRAIAMRANADPAQSLQVVLTMQPFIPASQAQPDDATPVE